MELVKRVSSERFKLLHDIYHMQIMEGDICATIKENSKYYDHYHTGGVPGRAEIDDTQELNYPRIMQAIIDTGFKGYVAQEARPEARSARVIVETNRRHLRRLIEGRALVEQVQFPPGAWPERNSHETKGWIAALLDRCRRHWLQNRRTAPMGNLQIHES